MHFLGYSDGQNRPQENIAAHWDPINNWLANDIVCNRGASHLHRPIADWPGVRHGRGTCSRLYIRNNTAASAWNAGRSRISLNIVRCFVPIYSRFDCIMASLINVLGDDSDCRFAAHVHDARIAKLPRGTIQTTESCKEFVPTTRLQMQYTTGNRSYAKLCAKNTSHTVICYFNRNCLQPANLPIHARVLHDCFVVLLSLLQKALVPRNSEAPNQPVIIEAAYHIGDVLWLIPVQWREYHNVLCRWSVQKIGHRLGLEHLHHCYGRHTIDFHHCRLRVNAPLWQTAPHLPVQ